VVPQIRQVPVVLTGQTVQVSQTGPVVLFRPEVHLVLLFRLDQETQEFLQDQSLPEVPQVRLVRWVQVDLLRRTDRSCQQGPQALKARAILPVHLDQGSLLALEHRQVLLSPVFLCCQQVRQDHSVLEIQGCL